MKVSIFHASAGYGHQKIAEVIARAFLDRGLTDRQVKVEDALDSTSFHFRKLYPALYFHSVKWTPKLWGWFYETLDHSRAYSFLRPFRSFGNRMEGARLLRKVIEEKPDAIICTHFFSAELFARAKTEGKIHSKLITVITDFYPHSFWVNEGTDLYWVMSEEGQDSLKRRGVAPDQIRAGGIPVDRQFYPTGKKEEIIKKWGFSQTRFTLLLTSGSFGLGPQAAILKELEAFSDRIQCFVVCGNNKNLKEVLEQEHYGYPVKIFGFVDFMPELMEASELMIAKSGGSTTAESLVKGIPMVVLHPIPGQETRNAELLKTRNAAFFMDQPEQIKIILQSIFGHPELLESKRRAIQDLAKPHAAEDLVSFVLKGDAA